ncbi:MAG: Gfo/Idh/MocA family protein [Sedimentisphaeraceae bacterium JB056]
MLSDVLGSKVFAQGEDVSANDKINVGFVGLGGMGRANLNAFLQQRDCRVVALCDIDKDHLDKAAGIVNDFYGDQICSVYHNFEELYARKDIDAVCLSLPDHWHGVASVMAAQAGKDIYGEKPLAHTLREGRAICEAVERYGRIWQTGSWQRSQTSFRYACEVILNGCIGKIKKVEVGLPAGPGFDIAKRNTLMSDPVPETLDYERWLGPAPYAPYSPNRVHFGWRWHLDYGGGQLTDWIGHHLDIAHWSLGLDREGPVEIDGKGKFIPQGAWNCPYEFDIDLTYKNAPPIKVCSQNEDVKQGIKWTGEKGWLFVSRGEIKASSRELLRLKFSPNEINLFRSPGHQRNFLDCVRSRSETITPCEIAHRSVSPGQLGMISMLLGRKLKFDPIAEKVINDSSADNMLGKSLRSPWVM